MQYQRSYRLKILKVLAVQEPDSTIFVMDGTIGQAAEGQAKAFKEAANFGSIIMTKMDGHAKGGGAISAYVLQSGQALKPDC